MSKEISTHILEGTSEVFEGADVALPSVADLFAHNYLSKVLNNWGQGNITIVEHPNQTHDASGFPLDTVEHSEKRVRVFIFNNEPELLDVNTFLRIGSLFSPVFHSMSDKGLPENVRRNLINEKISVLLTQQVGR